MPWFDLEASCKWGFFSPIMHNSKDESCFLLKNNFALVKYRQNIENMVLADNICRELLLIGNSKYIDFD